MATKSAKRNTASHLKENDFTAKKTKARQLIAGP
jgi:hypothetical protein